MQAIDFGVLVVYIAGVVGVGFWFARKSGTTSEFMAAGRSLPGWVVGLSIFGTYVSSISFLANPGKSYESNWNPFVFSLSLPIAAWIAVRWFVPFYRRAGDISAYKHLEDRFGSWARIYAVICFLLTQLARMGSIMYLVALAVAPLTGWNVPAIIIATGILVTVYTLLGGIEAVIWTDAVQSVILTLGILISCVVLLMGMPEGPGQIFQIASAQEKFSLGSLGTSVAEPTFWVVLAFGLFINLTNFGIDQSYVQRYITAKSDEAAKRSVWIGALLYLPISGLLFFIGTALFAFYQAQPDLLPAGGSLKSDEIFPHFIVTQLPVGLKGLLIAAVFAAAMSSVDSSLNCSATLFLCDFYKRYLRPNAGERESMRVLYGATLAWGAIGTGVALAMIQVKSVLDAWWMLSGIFSGGMLGLFLLGLISRRVRHPAPLVSVALGVLVILWLTICQIDKKPGWLSFVGSPFHSLLTIVIGTLTILLVGILISRFQSSPSMSDKDKALHDKRQ